MAKKFKKSGGLGSQMAHLEMAGFTLWFQGKSDFFGTSSILTPPNCSKNTNKPSETLNHMLMLYLGPKEHQNWAILGFLGSWHDLNALEKWGEKLNFRLFFTISLFHQFLSTGNHVETFQDKKKSSLKPNSVLKMVTWDVL